MYYNNETKENCMKKMKNWRPSASLLAGAAVLGLLVLLVPIVRIMRDAVPFSDDYGYGYFAKLGYLMGKNLPGVLMGVWENVKHTWWTWQGTYSSIFLMSLVPLVWGEQYYFWGLLFILLLLIGGVFALVKALVVDVLQGGWQQCLYIQAVTAALVVELMYYPAEGLFWYNGGIHYVGMHGFAMLLLATLICLSEWKKGRIRKGLLIAASIILALIVAGSNYVTVLQTFLAFLTIIVANALLHRNIKYVLRLVPAFCVYSIGFYKNLAAPGNTARAEALGNPGMAPLQAILFSFKEAFSHMWEYTGWMTIVVMLVLLPMILQLVSTTKFRFRLPWLLPVWSVCLYATGFTSSLYSLGHGGVPRTLNAVKITWQVLLVVNEIYLVGAIWQRHAGQKVLAADSLRGNFKWWVYPVLAVLAILVVKTCPNPVGTYVSYSAYYYVHTGDAYMYHRQFLNRLDALKGEEKVLVFEPYAYQPWLIYVGDGNQFPNQGNNYLLERWYGKESVSVATTE